MQQKLEKIAKSIYDIKNKNGESISVKDIRFKNCVGKNGIVIQDGPYIKYYWNGKNRKYLVDFLMPSEKLLVELKDNHYWHKQEVAIGKWKCKKKQH